MESMRAERYQKALDTIGFLVEELQEINHGAGSMEHLIVLPFIQKAVELQLGMSALDAAINMDASLRLNELT